MRWVRNLTAVGVLILVVVIGVIGQTDNADPLVLRFLAYETPPLGTFWWLLLAFITGTATGFGICFFGFVRGKMAERRLKRTVDEQRRELDAARGEGDAPG